MSKNNKQLSVDDLLLEIEKLKKENAQLKKRKKYGLVWEDKPEVFDEKTKNSLPVLKEKGGKFKDVVNDKDDNYNILIEGDNYHSLSVLNYTHRNKIDVIYIDPPYNTKNEGFIYNDRIVDKDDVFRHSKWISFMNKRLKLAKNLLSDDGVIFISIDDNEQAQLKLLCDEVFNENNFITSFVWHNNVKGRQMDKYVKGTYENILLYSRRENGAHINYEKDTISVDGLEKDNISFFKKDYPLHNGTADFHINNRPNLAYSIYYNPKTKDAVTIDEKEKIKGFYKIKGITRKDLISKGYIRIIPKYNLKYNNQRVWRWGSEKFHKEYKTELIFNESDQYFYQKKRFREDGSFEKVFKNYINIDGGEGKKQLVNIFDKKVFDNPKSINLLKHLFKITSKSHSIILDFMAGSGSTGHAVLDLNKEDGGNRKFILCTNNENKICEDVTWERIKRVSKGYKKQNGEKVEGLGGNLKYLKTDFISIENNADNLKEKVVEASTEILCLKENTFTEVIDDYKGNKIKIFENKDKYTAILFDLFYFDEFVRELEKLKDKKVSIYVFSYTKDFSANEFSELDINFTVEAIPEKVLETYKKIFNF